MIPCLNKQEPFVRNRKLVTGLGSRKGSFMSFSYGKTGNIWEKFSQLFLLFFSAIWGATPVEAVPPREQPNVILIMADDLGYGDLGCYGHPTIRTPNLDQMALEGIRLTDFYSAAAVCTPSRAGLLTGRYPIRSGMCESSGTRTVLHPDSPGGLPADEITIASILQRQGYRTAHIGKWHLGIHPGGLPSDHGFQTSLGLPYSNDMDRKAGLPESARASSNPPEKGWNVPLIENGEVIERPAVQATLTRRFTDAALDVILEESAKPFFVYLSYPMPHTPLFASEAFRHRSMRGLYGDVVEEIDWSVGEILRILKENNLAQNTFVFFTSDNGPWLSEGLQGGSPGILRGGKGDTWEAGSRVPGIAWMPGQISPMICSEPTIALDLLPTVAALAGAPLPDDRVIDGSDLSPLLFQQEARAEHPFFYYRGDQILACRMGDWKLHFSVQSGTGPLAPTVLDEPLLYFLPSDPAEQHPLNLTDHKNIVSRIQQSIASHRSSIRPVPPQLR